MHTAHSLAGFVTGFVSAALVLIGTWFWLGRQERTPAPQRDHLHDLSHYGRQCRRNRNRRHHS